MRKLLTINKKQYEVVDAIQNLRAEDSFIHNGLKLKKFTGNGEARKYVGNYKNDKKISNFFDYDEWGTYSEINDEGKPIRPYKEISRNCFFYKKNLIKYLNDSKEEYFNNTQDYHNNISYLYKGFYNDLSELNEINYFTILDISDLLGNNNNYSRAYIRSNHKDECSIWNLWRKMVLPKISYLSILKLKEKNNPKSESLFFFRVFLDHEYRSIIHSNEDIISQINQNRKRIGQPYFKNKVHQHMPRCPFTNIKEVKLLRASHIIPYKICETETTWKSNNQIPQNLKRQGLTNYHSIDKHNGLTLSITYDYLFDKGYITFLDDGHIICSSLFEDNTWSRLNIDESKKYEILPSGREKFLKYHREKVFKDDIELHLLPNT